MLGETLALDGHTLAVGTAVRLNITSPCGRWAMTTLAQGGHAAATLAKFQVPEAEQRDVVAFVQSLSKEIVE